MRNHLDDDALLGDGLPRRRLDVPTLVRRIAARKRWVVGSALACLAVSTVAVHRLPQRYSAETTVLIEGQEPWFGRPGTTETQALPDDEAVQSQVQLVASRDLARQAIAALDLTGNPEFDPLAARVGPLGRLMILLGLERDPLRVAPEERVLPRFSDRLTVTPVARSRVLTIAFASQDAELAARAANTVADLYRTVEAAAKRDAARQAAEALQPVVADLRTRSAEAEAKAEAFRSQSGLFTGADDGSAPDLATELAQARAAAAEAQSKARRIRDLVKGGRLAEVPDVAGTELIRRLTEQRATTEAEAALQARTLLPGHPRMQELAAQLGNFDLQLRAAAEKAARGLDADAATAETRIGTLMAAIASRKAAIGTAGPDQVKQRELDLTARLLKDQLAFNASRYQEAQARESAGAAAAGARIISRAVAPPLPSDPKRLPIVAAATLAGALLSLGIVVLRELLSGRAFAGRQAPAAVPISLDRRVSRPAQPEPMRLRPSLDPAWDRGPAVETAQRFGEAGDFDPTAALLGELATLKRTEQALRVLVLDIGASGVSGIVALRLGRALSRSARAVAVDLARAAGGRGSDTGLEGVTELLGGQATFAEVIHRDPQSRLHLIAGGMAAGAPDEDGVANILDALAETYDHVLMSGLGAAGDFAAFVGGEHADVLVLASSAPVSAAQRDLCRAVLGVDGGSGFPVLTVQVEAEPIALVREEEAA